MGYAETAEAIMQKTRSREDALGLRDETCRSRFLLQRQPAATVILFFHGFTAVPQQFVPIGEALFRAGHSVLVPLLPGHGQAGDWGEDQPPPLPENPLIYQDFGQTWLEYARSLGERVIVGGLSGGSTLAAWLGLVQSPLVDRSLLFAPYLSSPNSLVDWLIERTALYFEWKSQPGTVSFGYKGFRMPALKAFADLGQAVLERVQVGPTAPMLLVSSEDDQAVDRGDHKTLFRAAVQQQPQSWYVCFDRSLKIPHNMLTEAEGNAHADLVVALAKAYVESRLTWDDVLALSARVEQGESLDVSVQAFQLSQCVSPDRAALQTALQLLGSQRQVL